MERYRLKNIIILILVLVNAFLLASLSIRKSAEQDAFRRTAEQLVALFEADGMTLDIYAISRDTPPDALTLARDTTLEQKAAGYLLDGSPTGNDQGGGIYEYRTAAGTALFRSSGSFEASGVLAEEDAGNSAIRFPSANRFSNWKTAAAQRLLSVYTIICRFLTATLHSPLRKACLLPWTAYCCLQTARQPPIHKRH